MIWCTYDIIKFRKKWTAMTPSAHHQAESTDTATGDPQHISYFPDVNNTGGLFMKFGAACEYSSLSLSHKKCRDSRCACRSVLCMGSLLLSIVELAETVEMLHSHPPTYEILFVSYSRPVFITKAMTFMCRFVFHAVQFLFLFRYGNVSPISQRKKKLSEYNPRFLLLQIVIDCHRIIAKIGLIHVVIANFCTWFEGTLNDESSSEVKYCSISAIVIETLEELHKNPAGDQSTSATSNVTHTLQIGMTSRRSLNEH